MNTSHDVSIYKVEHRKDSRRRPYRVRWRVAGAPKPFWEQFAKERQAENFRSGLVAATDRGEAFDVDSGYPVSIAAKRLEEAKRANAVSTYVHFVEYIDHKWPVSAGNRRKALAEVLTDVMCHLLPDRPDRPSESVLRRALFRRAFNTRDRNLALPKNASDAERFVEQELGDVVTWVKTHAPPLTVLTDLAALRKLLDAMARLQNGKSASPAYFSKRRRILYNLFKFAVTNKHLTAVPLDDPDLKWVKPSDFEVEDAIDPRSVGNVDQVERMLTAVSYVGRTQGPRFVAFFACVFYAMARPEEVADLRKDQCELPEKGWGRLLFAGAAAVPGAAWTDDGEAHELRALKHRSRSAVRIVPIPPRLVTLLRQHIETFKVAADGRLFRTINRGRILPSTWWRVWSKARDYGLSPIDRASLLLKWAYLLRASGVTARLYAGVPDRQVAEWAGHSVEVLQRVYSRILEGFDTKWHSKMDGVFGGDGPDEAEDPDPGQSPDTPRT
ncbi:tyrosine-type recombinase/integrase [Phytomonospora endophytica]|uniref:Tyr recombinase domain-containing protein n=1 Tax=Phytomonospora endophytica TaxID=714109 RepID=A0A841FWX8_9ACTN|nr:integrase [Phytomonospora endophytica]MBB6038238.1 hypothetical protein [Phytomonospora endophytica]GIG67302.1 site-specific integrase [Phytomonospora endophytica]